MGNSQNLEYGWQEPCDDAHGSSECQRLHEEFDVCVPGTMLYYDMIDKCRLTCGLCDPWMGAREKMNEVVVEEEFLSNEIRCEDHLASPVHPNPRRNCRVFANLCYQDTAIGRRVFRECPVTCQSCPQLDYPNCKDTLTSSAHSDPATNCRSFRQYCNRNGSIAQWIKEECKRTCGLC